jgi:hypothetical protein
MKMFVFQKDNEFEDMDNIIRAKLWKMDPETQGKYP